ncbi:hypothetical protein B0H16DRAFT_1402350 [Mycena metata]|uniref:MYND-type domain-containing protein n=1 Tax=Mycena metata TaxID=1033252 RepID=A0AAD7KFD7_9AGAR|nr:hypothetical protein B0H16DRAFT_1402350 [Mycena metata]
MDQDRRAASNKQAGRQLVSQNKQAGPQEDLDGYYKGYTFLHMSIDDTDPPLACEMIRQGTLEKVNSRGETPLLQAMQRISQLWLFLKQYRNLATPTEFQTCREQIENALARIRYIAVVLIGQHADVNATVKDSQGQLVSTLHFAFVTDDWDLVTLLLEHGAHSKPTPSCVDAETLLPTAAKRRLAALNEKAKGVTRPRRLCPCFSGKPLSDCHTQSRPYPNDFTCFCGSTKVYGKCCKTRSIPITEIWHEEDKCILRIRSFVPDLPSYALPEVHAIMEQVRQNGDWEKVMQMVPEMIFNPNIQSVRTEVLELGLRENIGDPGFKFAYFETNFFPIIGVARNKRREWNAAVDKYIESGVDSRPRSDIEAAAKIGISLGAMLRVCEADSCDKVEGRDMDKVLTCARCKMTFYCSPQCQKTDWSAHKPVCGSSAQTERPLPSQVELFNFVTKYSPALMKFRMAEGSIEGMDLERFLNGLS